MTNDEAAAPLNPVYAAARERVGDTNGDGYWLRAGQPRRVGQPWGGAFLRECLIESGADATLAWMTDPYLPHRIAQDAYRAGLMLPTAEARPGDLVFFRGEGGHFACGIVEEATPTDVYYVIGDYRFGDRPPRVAHARYPIDRVFGVVRPTT